MMTKYKIGERLFKNFHKMLQNKKKEKRDCFFYFFQKNYLINYNYQTLFVSSITFYI